MREVTQLRVLAVSVVLAFVVALSGNSLAQDATSTVTPTSNSTPTPTPTPPPDLLAFEINPKGGTLGDFFSASIKAGKSSDLVVVLANTGNIVFDARTYAVNAFSAINGGFSVADADTPPKGQTTWLDYPEEVYTIQTGAGLERTFTVTVPAGTKPGQYVTAIAMEPSEAQTIEGSQNFKQLVRFAVPVVITVPGPIEPAFKVGDVVLTATETSAVLDVKIVNTGNIRVRPAGTVTVADAVGTVLLSAPVSMGSVFAGDTTSLVIELPRSLAPGDYHISVDLTDPDTKAAAKREVVVTATAPATPAPPPPVQLVVATGTPRPDAKNVQFLDIAATVQNTGQPLTNVQLVLHVTHDGQPVEDFALASSLAIPTGETPFQARYIPATGWSSGAWSFQLSVRAVDPSTGVAQILSTADLADLVIP